MTKRFQIELKANKLGKTLETFLNYEEYLHWEDPTDISSEQALSSKNEVLMVRKIFTKMLDRC